MPASTSKATSDRYRRKMSEDSFLFGSNAIFVETLYEQYLENPESVDPKWRSYFDKISEGAPPQIPHSAIVSDLIANATSQPLSGLKGEAPRSTKQLAVHRLVTNYRFIGNRFANINPIDYDVSANNGDPHLDPVTYGLGPEDMDCEFETDIPGMRRASLREIMLALHQTYCGTFVPEYAHISDYEQREWVRDHFEKIRSMPKFSSEQRLFLLERLTAAETLENHLHTKYVGQKRFSLEGGETLIPMLDGLLMYAGENGVVEVALGMAHRGRLNVLVNTLGKLPADLFAEFEGKKQIQRGSGDVKYHMGFSSQLSTPGGSVHLALSFNPSHLEIVGPVVEGSVRARQDRRSDLKRSSVMPVLIHGDAAFAGQGVVMETLNLSQTKGFRTGGTIHIIVNNQIGFTTSAPDDARSTFFSSDVAKIIEAPVFHVNGDDPDSALGAVHAAFEYRKKFCRDVVIDLVCFRRHGHNEQDEPMVTQPLMYSKIRSHPSVRSVYASRLIEDGVLSAEKSEEMIKDFRGRLDSGESTNPNASPASSSEFVDWKKFNNDDWDVSYKTTFGKTQLIKLGKKISTLPDKFLPHSRLRRIIEQRAEMASGKIPLDWGMGENLAYATLLDAGFNIRISGQDCGRGTFFHRHAVWHDQNRSKRDGGSYLPLRNLKPKQGDFLVIDSLLSEEAVLAFEYGYATTSPDTLVVWEAQFGDFANGAQVVIDQFIAAGEFKWGRYCGLVMLLPHGYEGQGPEHSSCRIERYLQLCAEHNMQICIPSTPAQIYHLLRRQILRPYRRPLIVVTPKSLLRHKGATSNLEELSEEAFQAVIPDYNGPPPNKVDSVVVCSGKIYYELFEAREAKGLDNIALVRLEQLYPFPHEQFGRLMAKYKRAKMVRWCQEEPGNQGAWHRIQHYLRRHIRKDQELLYSLRVSAASPAVGNASRHKEQQNEIIDVALSLDPIKERIRTGMKK